VNIIVHTLERCQQVLTVYNAINDKNFEGVLKMSAYDLVERAKRQLNIESDYQLSQKLAVSRGLISNWKSGRNAPDGVMMLKLTEIAGMTAHDALLLVTQKSQQQELAFSDVSGMVYIM
jgi:DNA-binding transcriptional regulator YiaG